MASELKNLSIYSETGIAKQDPEHPYRIGIAVSEWNQEITANLANGAIETLKKYGYNDDDIVLRSVPGSFELPLRLSRLRNTRRHQALRLRLLGRNPRYYGCEHQICNTGRIRFAHNQQPAAGNRSRRGQTRQQRNRSSRSSIENAYPEK